MASNKKLVNSFKAAVTQRGNDSVGGASVCLYQHRRLHDT